MAPPNNPTFRRAGRGSGRGNAFRSTFAQTSNIPATVLEGSIENTEAEVENELKIRLECPQGELHVALRSLLSRLNSIDGAKVTLCNHEKAQFFVEPKDVPAEEDTNRHQFKPETTMRNGKAFAVVRLTLSSAFDLQTLKRKGLNEWLRKAKANVEEDIFLTHHLKDCALVLLKNEHTNKQHFKKELIDAISNLPQASADDKHDSDLQSTAESEIRKLKDETTHNGGVPPFSMHWRRGFRLGTSMTNCIMTRCDRISQTYFATVLGRLNAFDEKLDHAAPQFCMISWLRNNKPLVLKCMSNQNAFLSKTKSIPLIGLPSESLDVETDIIEEIPGENNAIQKTKFVDLILEHALHLEPTSKTESNGRYAMVVMKELYDDAKNFVQNDLPTLWKQMPDDIRQKFSKHGSMSYPRLTLGESAPRSVISSTMSERTDFASLFSADSEQCLQPPDPTNAWSQPPPILPRTIRTPGTFPASQSNETVVTRGEETYVTKDASTFTQDQNSHVEHLQERDRKRDEQFEKMNKQMMAMNESMMKMFQVFSQQASPRAFIPADSSAITNAALPTNESMDLDNIDQSRKRLTFETPQEGSEQEHKKSNTNSAPIKSGSGSSMESPTRAGTDDLHDEVEAEGGLNPSLPFTAGKEDDDDDAVMTA